MYRMTPYNVTGVLQHDTGDVRGDLGFLLVKYLDSSMCSPPYNTRESVESLPALCPLSRIGPQVATGHCDSGALFGVVAIDTRHH